MSSGASFRRGMTAVELLVGATVLSMTAAVVVPGMGQARSRSILAAERNNLRAIAQLMAKYSSEDPNGVLGPVHPQAYNFIFEGYAEYGGGPGTMRFLNWGEQFDPRTRPFNHLLYGRNAINEVTAPGERAYFREFQCLGADRGWQKWPGFGTHPRETERPYFEGNGTSFRMSNLQFDGSDTGGGVIGANIQIINVSIYGRRADRIPFPSETLAFFEARVFQTLFTNDVRPYVSPGELTGCHGRLGHFNVIYADGRSDFVDFGNGTYYEHAPQYNEFDARGTWGRFDCWPDISAGVGFFHASQSAARTPREKQPGLTAQAAQVQP